MPAEWEPHAGTWLAWPHNAETWPGRMEAVERAYVAMVAALCSGEQVRILVTGEAMLVHVSRLLRAHGVPLAKVRFPIWYTNDSWVRDSGASFVVRGDGFTGEQAAICWTFNAWGGKYPPWDRDALVGSHMATALQVRAYHAGIVLEGGSIEPNGAGCLLTTEQCLLNPNRNPQLSRAELERYLCDHLGVKQVLWLSEGIAGDDTDGHIDDIARFVSIDTVACAVEPNPNHVNHAPLAENRERLRHMRDVDGKPLHIIDLPMPPDQFDEAGELLPASYANFYVANTVVLMPSYHPETDTQAQKILEAAFPARRIVPIRSNDLVFGLGSVHCLTQPFFAVTAVGSSPTPCAPTL